VTGDELAIALKERQGFVLVATTRKLSRGHILQPENAGSPNSKTEAIRLMIAGDATEAEYGKQMELVAELVGTRTAVPAGCYFYRVEAAD
jgi:hypothetical protein